MAVDTIQITNPITNLVKFNKTSTRTASISNIDPNLGTGEATIIIKTTTKDTIIIKITTKGTIIIKTTTAAKIGSKIIGSNFQSMMNISPLIKLNQCLKPFKSSSNQIEMR